MTIQFVDILGNLVRISLSYTKERLTYSLRYKYDLKETGYNPIFKKLNFTLHRKVPITSEELISVFGVKAKLNLLSQLLDILHYLVHAT